MICTNDKISTKNSLTIRMRSRKCSERVLNLVLPRLYLFVWLIIYLCVFFFFSSQWLNNINASFFSTYSCNSVQKCDLWFILSMWIATHMAFPTIEYTLASNRKIDCLTSKYWFSLVVFVAFFLLIICSSFFFFLYSFTLLFIDFFFICCLVPIRITASCIQITQCVALTHIHRWLIANMLATLFHETNSTHDLFMFWNIKCFTRKIISNANGVQTITL